MDIIRFSGGRGAYGCFSNFARYPISVQGKTWPTSEHFYQAQKHAGTPLEEKIRRAQSPKSAARLGRSDILPLRPDWEEVKVEVMREALFAKFTQHSDLREILLGTGDALLVEHSRRDSYWGDGGDGQGKNMLGKLLMQVREALKENNELGRLNGEMIR